MILQKQLVVNAKYEENKQYNVLYQQSLEFGYEDVTNSILDWDMHGGVIGKDYKYIREKIKTLAGDLSGLNDDEKLVSAQWMCPSPEDSQVQTLLSSDYNIYLEKWIEGGKSSRELRWSACKKAAFSLVVESFSALNSILDDNLHEKYLEGIESLNEDGFDGLIDWISSTNGYTSSGLINGGYTPIDTNNTMQDISNILLNIVQNGNYS